jgi:type II pantothenate kinase
LSYSPPPSISLNGDANQNPDQRDGSVSPSPVRNRTNGALTPAILNNQKNGVQIDLDRRVKAELMRRNSVLNFPGGSVNFEVFETDNLHDCVQFIQDLIERSAHVNKVSIEDMKKGVQIIGTGGGAHKFKEVFEESLGMKIEREDEMDCLITGLKFITHIPQEVYYFSDELIHAVTHRDGKQELPNPQPDLLERPSPDPPKYSVTFEDGLEPQLPCLLVNIGSGVSIIKIDEDGSFERVSGTSLGGGTLWGLLSMLTGASSFDGLLLLVAHAVHYAKHILRNARAFRKGG